MVVVGAMQHGLSTNRNSADFGLIHFFFLLMLYLLPFRLACPDHFVARVFPPRRPASAAISDPVRPYLST
jgi:hypothetical protein